MPSVALDRAGNLALGYSTSSSTTKPAIKYAGRLAGDAANTFSQGEQLLVQGAGTQVGSCGGTCTRWGDYSAMTLDPNGCTFWYTNMFYDTDGLDHHTKIGAFTYPGCTTVGAGGTVQGTVTASAGGAPIAGAAVYFGSRKTTTDGSGFYSFSVPAGTYPVLTAQAGGYASGSFTSVVVTDGGTTTRDFSLASFAASGCFVDTTQSDFQLGLSTNCDLNATPGAIALVNTPVVDQANASVTNNGFGFTSTSWAGQTFMAAASGPLTKVELFLFCSGCTGTTPNLTVSIRATTGSPAVPTGGDLAAATIAGFSSGAGGYFAATFGAPAVITAGTRYAIVVRAVSNPSAGIYAYVCSCTPDTNPYANGQRVTSATSGSAWTADTTAGGRDLGFKVYVQSGYQPSGTFMSETKDANPAAGAWAQWSTISFNATTGAPNPNTPDTTGVQFQAAASASQYGPFNFVGPDGTAGTNFSSGGSLAQFNGRRYLKYKAVLTSNDPAQTPTVNDVTVCYTNTPFTDYPLTAGIVAKIVHITELRTRIDALRQRFGLGAFGWSDTPLTAPSGVTAIKKVHIDQLRSALDAAYTAHGVSPPAPTYTEPTITQFVTTVKAVHINELRAAVVLLENTP
jgi:hypothetical protein